MNSIAAIGAPLEIGMLGLGGARLHPAESTDEVRAAWTALAGDDAVVVLTETAAAALGAERVAPGAPLTVVMAPWPA